MPDNLDLKYSIRLMSWSGYYGIWPYVARLGSMLQLPKDDFSAQVSNKILRFKQTGKHSDEIKLLISTIAKHFGCDSVLIVPPSDPDKQPSSLQKLFGQKINRIKPVETRKYNHAKPLSDDYSTSYEVKEDSKKPLIVDDVLRTGKTMCHFASHLGGVGLSVGMYYKLPYVLGDSISIFEQKQKSDMIYSLIEDISFLNFKL